MNDFGKVERNFRENTQITTSWVHHNIQTMVPHFYQSENHGSTCPIQNTMVPHFETMGPSYSNHGTTFLPLKPWVHLSDKNTMVPHFENHGSIIFKPWYHIILKQT